MFSIIAQLSYQCHQHKLKSCGLLQLVPQISLKNYEIVSSSYQLCAPLWISHVSSDRLLQLPRSSRLLPPESPHSSKQWGCCSSVPVVPTASRGANWYYTGLWGGGGCVNQRPPALDQLHNGNIPRYTSPLGGSPSCYHYAGRLILHPSLSPSGLQAVCGGGAPWWTNHCTFHFREECCTVLHWPKVTAVCPIDNCDVILWFGVQSISIMPLSKGKVGKFSYFPQHWSHLHTWSRCWYIAAKNITTSYFLWHVGQSFNDISQSSSSVVFSALRPLREKSRSKGARHLIRVVVHAFCPIFATSTMSHWTTSVVQYFLPLTVHQHWSYMYTM